MTDLSHSLSFLLVLPLLGRQAHEGETHMHLFSNVKYSEVLLGVTPGCTQVRPGAQFMRDRGWDWAPDNIQGSCCMPRVGRVGGHGPLYG